MNNKVLTKQEVEQRAYWVDEISRLSGDFGVDSDRVAQEIAKEIQQKGLAALIGHLRLCGAIPERYGHDSSEEKLYSKYTDVVIHEAYAAMGLTSLVLKERADVADVECVCAAYSFVADAKAFRLSRTAKNQKDFKVQAMDNWKHGKPYAMGFALCTNSRRAQARYTNRPLPGTSLLPPTHTWPCWRDTLIKSGKQRLNDSFTRYSRLSRQ